MGTQGEIYNLLGLKLPAETVEKDRLYRVNGKTVAADEDHTEGTDFVNVIPTVAVDLKNPNLVVRLLGYDHVMKSHHFSGEALVGYVLANESYIASATPLPPNKKIDELRTKLVDDLRERLGYDTQPNQLEVFLMFDFKQ